MLKTKKSYLVIILALTLSACNGESDSPTPTVPDVPTVPTVPELPEDPELTITNDPREYPIILPANPLSRDENPIINGAVVTAPEVDPSPISDYTYTDNLSGIVLFSKNKLTDKEILTDKELKVYLNKRSVDKVSVYNTEDASLEHVYTAMSEVQDSLTNSFKTIFPLHSDFADSLYSGSNAVSCLISLDYSNYLLGDPLSIITDDEAAMITTMQAERNDPMKLSPYVINKVMRDYTLANDVNKRNITLNSISYFSANPSAFTDAEINDSLEYMCKGRSEDYTYYLNSITTTYNEILSGSTSPSDENVPIEVEISPSESSTYATQNKIVLTGLGTTDVAENLITKDLINNLLVKQMILNKIFNWNGDGYSYLSKHSFVNSEFTGLFEGIASHYALQNYTVRTESTSCNPVDVTSVTNGCSYPQVYGDYGLFVAYLQSATNAGINTEILEAKQDNLLNFISSLETYNAVGCGLEWSDVGYDQVEMSNKCLEVAFDAADFTTPSGESLTWNDLKTNWFTYLNEYQSDLTALPLVNTNENITSVEDGKGD